MENQTTSSKSIMLNYGLYLGIAGILIQVIIYALGLSYEQPWYAGVIGFVITAVLIFMGSKAFRTANNDLLGFGEGLKIGMGIVLVGTILGLIYQQIFINVIEPDFVANTMEIAKQNMVEQNMTSEQIDAAMEMSAKFSSPLMQMAFGLIWSLFVGFIISLITSLILKRTEE
ncbi:MAG: DUF4199 domain-containing protein [Flavobacteriaceae bacterium]